MAGSRDTIQEHMQQVVDESEYNIAFKIRNLVRWDRDSDYSPTQVAQSVAIYTSAIEREKMILRAHTEHQQRIEAWFQENPEENDE